MPRSAPSLLLAGLLAVALFPAAIPRAGAAEIRLLWDGNPEAAAYELEYARDAAFTQGLQKVALKNPAQLLSLPALPAHARIRAVFGDRSAAPWFPLQSRNWKAVELPAVISVLADQPGKGVIEWNPPPDGRARELTYHARVTLPNGRVLQEVLVSEPRLVLPILPGGDYLLTVEAVGDARAGTLHREGEGVAHARIAASVFDYDPQARAKDLKAQDLAGLTSPFVPGLLAGAELDAGKNPDSFKDSHSHEQYRRLVLSPTFQFTSDRGWQWGAAIPVVLGGEEPKDHNVHPRIGGVPYPNFWLYRRLYEDPHLTVGLGARYQTSTDTSGQFSLFPNIILGVVTGRLAWQRWLLAFQVQLGSSFKHTTTGAFGGDGQPVEATLSPFSESRFTLSPAFLVRPNLIVGAEAFWFAQGGIQIQVNGQPQEASQEISFRSLGGFVIYQLSPAAFARAGFSVVAADPTFEDMRSHFTLGASIVF